MPRPFVHICPQGHDKRVLGRTSQGGCLACHRSSQERRRRRKLAAIHRYKLRKGCEECGYRKSAYALDLHHRDPTQKLFTIGGCGNVSWARIVAEIKKCIVLCRNCHAEKHHEEI